jgi:hypothetical protein
MSRTLIVLTVVAVLLTGWTCYMLWILAVAWATGIAWWASVLVLAAGPVAIVTCILALRRRAWGLAALNGLLAAAHIALIAWLIVGSTRKLPTVTETHHPDGRIERDTTWQSR